MCRPTKRPRPVALAPMMPIKVEELMQPSFVDAGKDLDTFASLADLLNDGDDMFMQQTAALDTAEFSMQQQDGSGEARPRTFVFTAFDMVSNPENAAAVGFNSDGTALEIRDLVLLSEKVLPKYFRHKNVTSFYRQLNSYGFRTIRSSTADIAHTFSHDLFRKDRPDLLNSIIRKKCCPKEKKAMTSNSNNNSSSESTPVTSPSSSISASSSPDVSFNVAAVEAAPATESVVLSEEQQLEEARHAQRKAKERARALEARNRALAEENKSILTESELIFQQMNLLVEAQTAAILKLFGREAANAFADQAKPFRFDFEQPAAAAMQARMEKAAPQVQAQAQDFSDFVGESNDFLFQDEELEMLENIFQV